MKNVVIHNPVLKGFNPDPSILRAGKDYGYLYKFIFAATGCTVRGRR